MKVSIMMMMLILIAGDFAASSGTNSSPQDRRRQRRREERQRRAEERRQDRDERARQRDERARQRQEESFNNRYYNNNTTSPLNMTDAFETFKSFFPSSAPRHIGEGTVRAIACAAVAGVTSTASVTLIPLALSAQMGVYKGLPLGLIVGFLGSTVSAIIGVSASVYHLALGVWQTPSAVYASWWQGKHWDSLSHTYWIYDLQKEAEEFLRSEGHHSGVTPADNSLYRLLEVASNATTKDIKKAYRTKAKKLHPDKNPGDEKAIELFLKLHQAYQTLSDENQRKAYDEYGHHAESDNAFNVELFFEIVFGLHAEVEPYTGALKVSSLLRQIIRLKDLSSSGGDKLLSSLYSESKLRQRQRRVQVAMNLLEKIEPFANNNMTSAAFRAHCKHEADLVAKSGIYGLKFLEIIGNTLMVEATTYFKHSSVLRFDRSLRWSYQMVKKKYKRVHNRLHSIHIIGQVIWSLFQGSEGIESSTAADDFNNTEEGASEEKKKRQRITTETIVQLLPQIMDMAWAYNRVDIDSVLQAACWKLTHDSSVNHSERNNRAHALLMLGLEFQETAAAMVEDDTFATDSDEDGDNSSCNDPEIAAQNIQARVEVAYYVAKMGGSFTRSESEDLIRKRQSEQLVKNARSAQTAS